MRARLGDSRSVHPSLPADKGKGAHYFMLEFCYFGAMFGAYYCVFAPQNATLRKVRECVWGGGKGGPSAPRRAAVGWCALDT